MAAPSPQAANILPPADDRALAAAAWESSSIGRWGYAGWYRPYGYGYGYSGLRLWYGAPYGRYYPGYRFGPGYAGYGPTAPGYPAPAWDSMGPAPGPAELVAPPTPSDPGVHHW